TAVVDVTVTEGAEPTAQPAFRAVVSTNVNSRSPSVTVPSLVEAGDVLVLVASMNNESPSVAGPAGWTSLGSAADSTATVQTHAWWKKASAGDAGSVVTVSMTPNGAKTALQLLAYSDADVVSAAAVDIDTVSGTVRTTPSVPVARDGSVLVSYWADKSGGSSGWELPAGVTERDQTIGSGGGLMAAAVADSGPLAAGTGGGLTATSTASANRRGITWSIVIAPVETGASPSNQSPEASF